MAATHLANNEGGTRSWAEVMPPQPDTWNQNNNDNIAEYLSAADTAEGQGDRFGFIARNKYIFRAPVIVYITIPKNSTMYQAYDAGAFGYAISLAAHAHGLASIPAYEFVRFPQEIRDAIEIPENESILMGIGIGYPDDAEINSFDKLNGRVPTETILTIKD
ncbi:MAG: nitroreductase family protein [Coriobacteriales bacterium]|nr:nitroreductase family protein [Coriobacteriales bacterium]